MKSKYEVREYRQDGDYYEIYYLIDGFESEYFECNQDGSIFVHQLYSQSLGDWRPVENLSVDKKLFPLRYKDLRDKFQDLINEYDDQQACQMLDAKDRRMGII